MLSWLKKRFPFKERGEQLMLNLRRISYSVCEHADALGSLFITELREYARQQLVHLFLIMLGLAVLAFAYLICWVMLCLWLTEYLCLMNVLAIAAGFNVILAVILLLIGLSKKPKDFAPATKEMLQTDFECAKILLREKENS